jgi:outer membrane protein TolC
MCTAVILAAALLAQAKPDPDQFPLALHRSMEIDDLDREIQRLHDTVLMKRSQLAATQRLAARGGVSRSDVEREMASLRYEEAREVESKAYRELKLYERDIMGHVMEPDEQKAYGLLLNWVKTQEAIGQVDADYRGFILRQNQALYQRKAIGRSELEEAELNCDMALASVALSQSRQAQVLMELAARKGDKKYDPAEYDRLKAAYLQARVHYFEVIVTAAQRRLAIAQERSRRGLIPPSELPMFQKSLEDSQVALDAERKKLEKPEVIPVATPGANPAGTPAASPAATPGANPAGTPAASPAATPGPAPAPAPAPAATPPAR